MNFIWIRRASAMLALSLALSMTACGSDDNGASGNNNGENGNNNGENGGNTFIPNSQDQWLGAACGCDGSESPCDIFNIPLPTGSPITGCDNVPEVEGARRICLRTITEEYATTAPPTYFPEGYCALGAVDCKAETDDGDFYCKQAKYGDVGTFKSCPAGSALLGTDFDYNLMGEAVKIRARTCVKRCNTNEDCNTEGEMSCIERNKIKFCYNEQNFEHTGEPMVFAF